MGHRVGVVGASGYSGAELLRLIDPHPELDVGVVAAHSQAGHPVADLFPNLRQSRLFDEVDLAVLAELDLVFLATPHDASLQIAPALVDAGVPTVDLSGAFRLPAGDFATWYGHAHPAPDLAPATYGLTEWYRAEVADSTLVANPGCYPTATLLALLPLRDLVASGTVVIDAKSGTSGAGRAAKDSLHFSHVHGDLAAYGAPGHRHTGEIERWLSDGAAAPLGAVSFTPHLVPMSRGLLATCYATLGGDVTADDVQDAIQAAYTDEPFVHVLPPGTFPHTKALSGSNGCQLSAVVDERTNRVVVTAAIDNLGKGAAGQAIQNANLMLGLPETMGLTPIGIYP